MLTKNHSNLFQSVLTSTNLLSLCPQLFSFHSIQNWSIKNFSTFRSNFRLTTFTATTENILQVQIALHLNANKSNYRGFCCSCPKPMPDNPKKTLLVLTVKSIILEKFHAIVGVFGEFPFVLDSRNNNRNTYVKFPQNTPFWKLQSAKRRTESCTHTFTSSYN
jgi:hypothetical protein